MSNDEETVIKEKSSSLLSPEDWQSNDGSSPSLSRGNLYLHPSFQCNSYSLSYIFPPFIDHRHTQVYFVFTLGCISYVSVFVSFGKSLSLLSLLKKSWDSVFLANYPAKLISWLIELMIIYFPLFISPWILGIRLLILHFRLDDSCTQ